jgi:hypothetical protein
MTYARKTRQARPSRTAEDLRQILFSAVNPDVQALFYELEASRTPDEWIARREALYARLAVVRHRDSQLHKIAPEAGGVAAWPWPAIGPDAKSYPVHCPACNAATPPPQTLEHLRDDNNPVLRHLRGTAGEPCPVVSELLVHFDETVRSRKFMESTFAQAWTKYQGQLAPGKGQSATAETKRNVRPSK